MRIRLIHPQFWLQETLATLPPTTRLLFIGLWALADREGRLADRPSRIRAQIFPYEPEAQAQVEQGLNDLAAHGFIRRYVVDGQAIIRIPSWHRYQRPHPREAPSVFPDEPEAHPGVPEADLGTPKACLGLPLANLGMPEADLGVPATVHRTPSTSTPSTSTPGTGTAVSSTSEVHGDETVHGETRPSVGMPRQGVAAPQSPLTWWLRHRDHVPEFCDWVCLPESLVAELANRLPARHGTAEARRTHVLAWARDVRQRWANRTVTEPSIFTFWKRAWQDRDTLSELLDEEDT